MIFRPFSEVLGQERAIELLKRATSRGKIPHAYLFTGIQGIGKATTAVALARAINCSESSAGEGCGECRSCRQFKNGTFPDLVFVEPEGQKIKIGQIRALNRAIGFKPAFGRYRVCIISQAETMTDEAANSFLKILEEPPPGNILVLNVTEPLDLLPTIVSRCQKISFQPMAAKLISDWLMREEHVEEEKARVLASVSGGSLGKAVNMANSDFLEKRDDSLFQLSRLPKQTPVEVLETALEFTRKSKKKNVGAAQDTDWGLLDLFSTWKTWYRDLILTKAKGDQDLVINIDFSENLNKISRSYKIENLIDSFFCVEQAQRDLQRSRNADLLMENTLLELKRLAHS